MANDLGHFLSEKASEGRKATPLAEVLGLSSAVLLLHIPDISGSSTLTSLHSVLQSE